MQVLTVQYFISKRFWTIYLFIHLWYGWINIVSFFCWEFFYECSRGRMIWKGTLFHCHDAFWTHLLLSINGLCINDTNMKSHFYGSKTHFNIEKKTSQSHSQLHMSVLCALPVGSLDILYAVLGEPFHVNPPQPPVLWKLDTARGAEFAKTQMQWHWLYRIHVTFHFCQRCVTSWMVFMASPCIAMFQVVFFLHNLQAENWNGCDDFTLTKLHC